MAKAAAALKKPFGRQIAKLKDEAKQANPGATPEELAVAINAVAKAKGYDYTITADKLVEKPAKTPGKKRGRPAGSKNGLVASSPAEARPTVKATSNAVEVAQAVKALVDRFGASTVKQMADLFGK